MMVKKISQHQVAAFRKTVWQQYKTNARQFPWRKTRDPYAITVSELMLQQTQADRVVPKYESFLNRFPTWQKLARAPLSEVLREWNGLGYNRRAKLLHQLAKTVVEKYNGKLPRDYNQLIALPGIGPATATAIRAFAFNLSGVYLETNVRSVYLHHFFADKKDVSDKEILPLVEQTQDSKNPRQWNWALLDYGVVIKRNFINPNRRSRHYAKQSKFEGSHRQIRGKILKLLLENTVLTKDRLYSIIGAPKQDVDRALNQLVGEEMIAKQGVHYMAH